MKDRTIFVCLKKIIPPEHEDAAVARIRECFGASYADGIANKKSPAARRQSLAGACLLADMLSDRGVCGGTALRNENGKPYFADPDLPTFSLSHDGGGNSRNGNGGCGGCGDDYGYVLCALAPDGGNVGADLMICGGKRTPRIGAIAARCFTPDEAAAIAAAEGEERVLAFAKAWTAREAYVKLVGGRLGDTFGKALPDKYVYDTVTRRCGGVTAVFTVCHEPGAKVAPD